MFRDEKATFAIKTTEGIFFATIKTGKKVKYIEDDKGRKFRAYRNSGEYHNGI